ncbi:MAG: DUF4956 domain-containing protein [Butyrivibrio sp.]|jgi:uncharacterized membrane protein YhiD involved in acid resistance|uniref:DUF4956 domain-containing protein n=1 Tax=Butyrivibrio sp. LB2008 TaxID=1408305 RepID=UPI00047AA75E|nr:DUF4956 domain-containing protein [Butyrivibrio sp. LB2008]MEE3493835.1 DUF4956 domain-containing protein [Butyrivibrio sp.]
MKEYLYTSLMDEVSSLSIENVIMNFVAACILSLMIFISYRVSHSGAVYSRKFNVSLVMLALVTTLVMNVIGNNIALSLGMVGALSIVRFRTAIKDPRDTAYIFWAIAIGITCGVSDYVMAGIGTFIIFVFLVFFGVVRDNERIMIVMKAEADKVEDIDKEITSFFAGKAVMKLQNVNKDKNVAELIYEISETILKKREQANGAFVPNFSAKVGIKTVSLVRQDEEINQ